MNEKLQEAIIKALEGIQKNTPELWNNLAHQIWVKNWVMTGVGGLFLILIIVITILAVKKAIPFYKDNGGDPDVGLPLFFGSLLAIFMVSYCTNSVIANLESALAPDFALIQIIRGK
jgi:hypothetical protein